MDIIKQLIRHEGFKSKPYLDTEGVWTFGHGLTYITPEESEVVVRMRVDSIRNQLYSRIENLSQPRQCVAINMAYNLGVDGILKFRKMWAAIDAGDFELAAKEMLDSKWSRQVGERAKELAGIMRNG